MFVEYICILIGAQREESVYEYTLRHYATQSHNRVLQAIIVGESCTRRRRDIQVPIIRRTIEAVKNIAVNECQRMKPSNLIATDVNEPLPPD